MMTNERWVVLGSLVEACRPKGETLLENPRRTVLAIVWRHKNNAKWLAIPAAYSPWWRAAQLFIC